MAENVIFRFRLVQIKCPLGISGFLLRLDLQKRREDMCTHMSTCFSATGPSSPLVAFRSKTEVTRALNHEVNYCWAPLFHHHQSKLWHLTFYIPLCQSYLADIQRLRTELYAQSSACYLNLTCDIYCLVSAGPGGDMQWCFSQVKGAIDDDVAEGMSSVKHAQCVKKVCEIWQVLAGMKPLQPSSRLLLICVSSDSFPVAQPWSTTTQWCSCPSP